MPEKHALPKISVHPSMAGVTWSFGIGTKADDMANSEHIAQLTAGVVSVITGRWAHSQTIKMIVHLQPYNIHHVIHGDRTLQKQ
jgi:hypothetical protein